MSAASATSLPPAAPPPTQMAPGLAMVVVTWLALATTVLLLAGRTLSVPGLYYDEALYGGLAKDFLTGSPRGHHLPGCEVIALFGHPFPLYAQAYLGALKSWLVLPVFGVFGSGPGALRWSSLGWGLVSLLLFMLWTRRILGVGAALLVGALLALDPTLFFITCFDWGAVVPSLLCRSAGFYLAVLWWQRGRTLPAFLAAVFVGLGLFNKIDFAVLLGAVALAGVGCYLRPLHERLYDRPRVFALAALGFVLTASPMLAKLPQILDYALSGSAPAEPGELREKLNTLLAMYDGSYFYRLMNVGGVFERMYDSPSAVRTPFGFVVALAAAVLAASAGRRFLTGACRRTALFLVLAPLVATLGVFLLPEAVRVHHALLVYPLPQVAVAAALGLLWRRTVPARLAPRIVRLLLAAVVGIVLLADLVAITRTQRLILDTGGRGRWSSSLDTFCQQVRKRADLRIVSLDWGFNEQLLFQTEGPELAEPFWTFGGRLPAELPQSANYVYLVRPEQYCLFPYGSEFLSALRLAGTNADIQPHCDRQDRVSFYSIGFRQAGDGSATHR